MMDQSHVPARPQSTPEELAARVLTWKMFAVLMLGALVGAVGVIPYQLTLASEMLAEIEAPLWAIVASGIFNTLLLAGIATAVGLWLGPRVGLGAPVLRAWLAGDPAARSKARAFLPLAVGLGATLAALILIADLLIFVPQLQAALAGAPEVVRPTPWQGFFASFYGGIVEELLLRFGFMTFVVYLLSLLTGRERVGAGLMGVGILGAALLFAVGHLPAASQAMTMTPVLTARILVLNLFPGVAFGWLFWRHGLIAAIVAHFSADIVLHVIAPLLSRGTGLGG